MEFNQFNEFITAEHLMGANSMQILHELLTRYPLRLTHEDKLLDLGCGKGLTSMMLAKTTPARIYAADLWITEEENNANFAKWGVEKQIIAVQADATKLPFAHKQFDALVSVDAYHYFAAKPWVFEEKILPFLKGGAMVLIGVPGIKDAYGDRTDELLAPWLGEDTHMFKSPAQWRKIFSKSECIAQAHIWEMGCFEAAWRDWFSTGHEYAINDQKFYETILKPYTCFVGIAIAVR